MGVLDRTMESASITDKHGVMCNTNYRVCHTRTATCGSHVYTHTHRPKQLTICCNTVK